MKTIPVSLILAGLLAPLCAHAQSPEDSPPPPGRDGPGKRPHHRPFAEAWKKADTDGDGFLSREEFAAMPRIQNLPDEKHQKLFDRLDKNQDGKLTPAELYRHERQPDGPRQPARRLCGTRCGQERRREFRGIQGRPALPKTPRRAADGDFPPSGHRRRWRDHAQGQTGASQETGRRRFDRSAATARHLKGLVRMPTA